jgi:hypothetical protein
LSWRALLDLIEEEAGPELRERIERRLRAELPGARVVVPTRGRAPARRGRDVLRLDRPRPPKPRPPIIR